MSDAGEGLISQNELEALLSARQAPEEPSAKSNAPSTPAPAAAAFEMPKLPNDLKFDQFAQDLNVIYDVDLTVRVELGRSQMYIEDVLKLREGSIIPLDKLAGDPVDIYVNGQLLARGEVLVLNDNFCVRVCEIIAHHQVHLTRAAS